MNGARRNNLDDNLGIVAGRLWKLQDSLNSLENKINRTMLGLQSILDEEEEQKPEANEAEPVNEADSEIKDKAEMEDEEENVHHRSSANKLTEEIRVKKTDVDANKLAVQILNDFSSKNFSWKTCDYWSLPKWLQTNSYILKGHRPPLPSFQSCLFSIFRIHTETVNIWTHLLGCFLFIALFLQTVLSSIPVQDKLVLSPFFLGAILCLGLSSTFHTLHCHSQHIMEFSSRLDYCGIVLLIIGSFVPWLYYAFSCDSIVKHFYLAGVITLGVCAFLFSMSPTFNVPLYRPMRASVFVLLGLSGVVPGLHFILNDGWDAFIYMGTPLVLMGFFYITGAFFYASSIPERMFPGKCDILFQSHQVFHVLVLLATVIDYFGILKMSAFDRFGRINPDFCLRRRSYYHAINYL